MDDRITPPPIATLLASAYSIQQLLNVDAPQVAFAGRSNVGKSSLLNALLERKNLAKISSNPGKTRSINYYSLKDCNALLVDLPGYGYARCSQEERKKWAHLVQAYLQSTPELRAMALLLDSRLTPQPLDVQLANYAAAMQLRILPVFTKTDKCTKKNLQANLNAWEKCLRQPHFFITSAAQRTGLKELWQELIRLIR